METIRKKLALVLALTLVCGLFAMAVGTNAQAKTSKYTITGDSKTTVEEMVSFYKDRAAYPAKTFKKYGAPTINDFCTIVYEESEAEGIRAEVVFAQICHETGYLKFGGDVKPSQCNFCGLGATGGGAKGESFKNVRLGVRAQVQHLKAYANRKSLNKKCVDPRFRYVKRGTAKYVQWLGIQENPLHIGWASSRGYGVNMYNKLIKNMI